MQFFTTILLAATALASSVFAENTVKFINQDSTTRHIVFTSQSDLGFEKIDDLVLTGDATASQTFPTGWIGNWYSYNEGQFSELGMLGEVRFDGWNGLVFFDVSAIVDDKDTEGVKILYPEDDETNTSGCQSAVCVDRYNKWDDIATKATHTSKLVCLLGNPANSATKRSHPRSFVLGKSA